MQGKCVWCGYASQRDDLSHPPDHSPSSGARSSGTQWPRSRGPESSSGVSWEQVLAPAPPRPGALPERNTPVEPLTVPGQVLRGDLIGNGRYRLLDQIGLPENQRQQSIAWHALDILADHRRVVIYEIQVTKNLNTALAAAASRVVLSMVERFKALGEHPGFPKIIESFHEKNSDFLALLYPEGMSLSALLKQQGGALPEEQVASYGYQLCGLLAFMAAQEPPFVHGAITPETILLSHNLQEVTLLHLPLLPQTSPAPYGEEQRVAGYAAPEQIRSGEVTLAADLYSVAVCLHHAVTGYNPQTRLALFHPPARRLNPAVTPQMELILTRQLSLTLAQRYSHPDEMQRALATLLESYPEPASSEHAARSVKPLNLDTSQLREHSKSTLLLNMGVFAAICALLLMGIILLFLRS